MQEQGRNRSQEDIRNPSYAESENKAGASKAAVVIGEGVRKLFPDLFGSKMVDGRSVNVEETIGILYNELNEAIEQALTERRRVLESKISVSEKYSIPKWEEKFHDPVTGQVLSFRQIVQGLIDNFLGRKTEVTWRLNDETPIPKNVYPLDNPGLELTGPWHPLDMAIKQINADVAAVMGPDDEDAAPADYVPAGSPKPQPVGLFVSRSNERRLFAGDIQETTVTKKGERRIYRIKKQRNDWPTSFHRVPGMHLLTSYVTVNGTPTPSIIVDYAIHALNDFGSLKAIGSNLYYYQPKIQNPAEAAVVANLVWKLERLMGADRPGTFIKFKALYEEANVGRFLPVVMWIWRYWLIGTNVGRWDYTGSLIEMWKDERMLPDPQNGALMGMASNHMMAYQRYNALINVMAGMKNGRQTNGAPIGGMAAVMLYPDTDPYTRNRHNPVTLRAMKMDKLRERLVGLIFVPDKPLASGQEVTLSDILEHRISGSLYDAYRQSWVATPDKDYVAAGNISLRTPLPELQGMLDAPVIWEKIDEKVVAPKIESGLTKDERDLLTGLRLLDEKGRITPWVISGDLIDTPEKLFSRKLWGEKDLWGSLYDIPAGDVTIENIQHAFYMCANYGFQVLNGNLAAAIDDYKIVPNRVVRFMNDLATYRIFVGWLWTVLHARGKVSKDGFLKGPSLTDDGVIPGENSLRVNAGTIVSQELFDQLWTLHNEWTAAFFMDYDRLAAIRIIAGVIVDRQKGKEFPSSTREKLIERIIQRLAAIPSPIPQSDAASHISSILDTTIPAVEKDVKLMSELNQITEILSMTYGRGSTFSQEITFEESATQISRILGIEHSDASAEIEAAAPRFNRSEAPVIMDILKRQLLLSHYIQHSPRVLFAIADKSQEERAPILDAIYYVDARGNPLFRNEDGQPSRAKLLEAVEARIIPRQALDVHDYVYDIFQETR